MGASRGVPFPQRLHQPLRQQLLQALRCRPHARHQLLHKLQLLHKPQKPAFSRLIYAAGIAM